MKIHLAVFSLALALAAIPAASHDWFAGTKDPVSGSGCCGGDDCAAIPIELFDVGAVVEMKNGYSVKLTLPQARMFNRDTRKPVEDFLPFARVQPSKTGGFAMCIYQDRVQCFFAPQNT